MTLFRFSGKVTFDLGARSSASLSARCRTKHPEALTLQNQFPPLPFLPTLGRLKGETVHLGILRLRDEIDSSHFSESGTHMECIQTSGAHEQLPQRPLGL